MLNNTTCPSSNNVSIPWRCTSTNGEKDVDYYLYFNYTSFIIIVILSPVTVAGNAFILAAIWSRTFQRTPFHILLSGLAFTDLCTGLIAQPCVGASSLLYLVDPNIFTRRPVLCMTMSIIGVVSSGYFVILSLIIVAVMSVERGLYMSRRSLVTKRRGRITFAVLLLIPIPPTILKAWNNKDSTFEDKVNISIAAFMLFCYFTTFVAYVNVFRIIRQHQQQVQGNQSSQNFGQPAINLAKYKRSVVSILYILAVFSLCFLPIIVSLVIRAHVGDTQEMDAASNVSLMLLFLSSSLNPVLYLWRMNDIRYRVKQLLCSSCRDFRISLGV